ncbi:MerR family DNA-binding transcriptional regulator [Fretibacter rubidus]|uniref:MerR family transcriptional regulator n=1 Tax=Fretibacter rubidus TaxID=570162 RepID=UPI00352BA3B4
MSRQDFIPRDSIAQDTQSLPHVPDAGFWGIKDFAKLFSVTPRTIRFYEDKGLITPSREAGSRVFTPRDYVRVERILRGKRLGFSLDDIREVFEVADGHVTSRIELMRRKDNFRKVVKSLERRRHDIKQVTMEMDMMCQDIESFIQTTPDDEAGAVFKHAAAYAAAFAQTFSDDEYPLGYPATAQMSS